MTECVFLIIGLLIGASLGVATLCCMQVNRICEYEKEIDRLKKELKKKE